MADEEKKGTYTDKYSLYQPFEGEIGWGDDINDNFTKIDAALGITAGGDSPLAAANNRQILRYSTSSRAWEHVDLTLSSLDDITLDNYIKNGDILQFDGASQRWINVPVSNSGGGDGPLPGVSWLNISNPVKDEILIYVPGTPYGRFVNQTNPALLRDGSKTMTGDLDMNYHQILHVNTVVGTGDLVTKQYVDSRVGSIDWQDSVLNFFDPSSAIPANPSNGDRYISTGENLTVTPQWVANRIYHYTTETGWLSIYINKGCACYVELEESLFIFDGTVWTRLKGAIDTIAWQGPVLGFNDASNHIPLSPAIGDRYIASSSNTTTTPKWVTGHIYEYTQKGWVDYTPTEGWLIYVKSKKDLYIYNGTEWKTFLSKYEWLLDFEWLQPVNSFYSAVSALPTSPVEGDRYICNISGNGWSYGYIYTYISGAWAARSPKKGFTAYVLDLNLLYSYNGATWEKTNQNQSSDWQASVKSFFDPTTAIPQNPSLYDRYISIGVNVSVDPNWQTNYIYEYHGSSGWEMTITNNGCSCYVEDKDCIYVLNTDNGQWLPLTIGGENQYVHRTLSDTITARHTFNPIPETDAETGAVIATPFAIGSNVSLTAKRYTVTGLNAEYFDGYNSAILFQGDDVSPETKGEGINADMLDGRHSSDFSAAMHTHQQYVLGEEKNEVFTPASVTAKLNKQALNTKQTGYGLGHGSSIPSDTLDGLHADAFIKYTDTISHHSLVDCTTGDDHTMYLMLSGGPSGNRATMAAPINMSDHKIINLLDPENQTDAVNKLYVDYKIQGLEWKKEVMDLVTEPPTGASLFGGYRCIITESPGQYTSGGETNTFYEHANQIAQYSTINGWSYTTPVETWACYVYNIDRQYTFNGTIWVMFGGTSIHGNLRNLTSDDHPMYLRIDKSNRARMQTELNMEEDNGTRHMILNVADPGFYVDAVDGDYNRNAISRQYLERTGWVKPVMSIISGDIFRSMAAEAKLTHKGDRYLVGSIINGICGVDNAWRGDPTKAERIAEFDGVNWHWYDPKEGYCIYVNDIDTYLQVDGVWLGTALIYGSIDQNNIIRVWQGGRWAPLERQFSHNQMKGLNVGDSHTQYMRADGKRHDLVARHFFGEAHDDGSIPHDHVQWLKDVQIGTTDNGNELTDGQMLAWSSVSNRWVNIAPAGGAQYHQQFTDRLADTSHNMYIRTSQTEITNGYHTVASNATLTFDERWSELHTAASHSFLNIPHDYLKNLKDIKANFPDPLTLANKGHGMALVWDSTVLSNAGTVGAWTVKLPTLSAPVHNDSLERDLKCNHPQYFDYDRHRMGLFRQYCDCAYPIAGQYVPPVTVTDWVHQIPVTAGKVWPDDLLSSRASGSDGNIPHDALRQLSDVQFDLSIKTASGLNNGHVLIYECDIEDPKSGHWTNKLIPGLSTNHNTAFSSANRAQPNCHPQYITLAAHSSGYQEWDGTGTEGGNYSITCAHNYGDGGNLPYPDINKLINTKIGTGTGGKELAEGDIMVYSNGKWTNSSVVPAQGVYHHGLLESDLNDDHPQYMHVSLNRTITATHTFNPPIAGKDVNPPFTIGSNSYKQLVSGLNSQFLNGLIADDFSLTGHKHSVLAGTDSEEDYEPVNGMLLQYVKKVGETEGKWRPRLVVTDIGMENLEDVDVTGLTGRGQILYYTGSQWTYLQTPADKTVTKYLSIAEAGIPQWAEVTGGSGGTGVSNLHDLQDCTGLDDAVPSGPTQGALLYCKTVDTDDGTTTRSWTHLSPKATDAGKVLYYRYDAVNGGYVEWATNKPILKLADLSDMPADMNSATTGVPVGSILYCSDINTSTNARTWDTLDPSATSDYCLISTTVNSVKTVKWSSVDALVTVIDGGTP